MDGNGAIQGPYLVGRLSEDHENSTEVVPGLSKIGRAYVDSAASEDGSSAGWTGYVLEGIIGSCTWVKVCRTWLDD